LQRRYLVAPELHRGEGLPHGCRSHSIINELEGYVNGGVVTQGQVQSLIDIANAIAGAILHA